MGLVVDYADYNPNRGEVEGRTHRLVVHPQASKVHTACPSRCPSCDRSAVAPGAWADFAVSVLQTLGNRANTHEGNWDWPLYPSGYPLPAPQGMRSSCPCHRRSVVR